MSVLTTSMPQRLTRFDMYRPPLKYLPLKNLEWLGRLTRNFRDLPLARAHGWFKKLQRYTGSLPMARKDFIALAFVETMKLAVYRPPVFDVDAAQVQEGKRPTVEATMPQAAPKGGKGVTGKGGKGVASSINTALLTAYRAISDWIMVYRFEGPNQPYSFGWRPKDPELYY